MNTEQTSKNIFMYNITLVVVKVTTCNKYIVLSIFKKKTILNKHKTL